LSATGFTNESITGANATLLVDVIGDATTDLANTKDDIWMSWGLDSSGDIDSLGDTAGGTSEGEEIKAYVGTPGSETLTDIGSKDEDHLSRYGIIIQNPESQGSSDSVSLKLPSDQVMANIVIKGQSATVTSGGSTFVPSRITPVTKLASEVSDPTMYNLVLVGGPCANPLVETVFGMSCDAWSYGAGEGVVKLAANGDKVAMLVAGTSAMDTRRAAKAVANFEDHAFAGTESMVKGTSLSDVSVE